MRINRFVANSTALSRRAADQAVEEGRVTINGGKAVTGQMVLSGQQVKLDGTVLRLHKPELLLLNKPPGYVTSRAGQGSKTIYDLLPPNLHHLKPVGRLDKDSSGLLLLTNNGELAQKLAHPRFKKVKIYEVKLDKPLQPHHHQMIQGQGVRLQDGLSRFIPERLAEGDDTTWQAILHEGRNRQIRRTFEALGYDVVTLHRTHFGPYGVTGLALGAYRKVAFP